MLPLAHTLHYRATTHDVPDMSTSSIETNLLPHGKIGCTKPNSTNVCRTRDNSAHSSSISVWMDASSLTFFCRYVSLWRNTKWAEWLCLNCHVEVKQKWRHRRSSIQCLRWSSNSTLSHNFSWEWYINMKLAPKLLPKSIHLWWQAKMINFVRFPIQYSTLEIQHHMETQHNGPYRIAGNFGKHWIWRISHLNVLVNFKFCDRECFCIVS